MEQLEETAALNSACEWKVWSNSLSENTNVGLI